jgi:hypothetical protein
MKDENQVRRPSKPRQERGSNPSYRVQVLETSIMQNDSETDTLPLNQSFLKTMNLSDADSSSQRKEFANLPVVNTPFLMIYNVRNRVLLHLHQDEAKESIPVEKDIDPSRYLLQRLSSLREQIQHFSEYHDLDSYMQLFQKGWEMLTLPLFQEQFSFHLPTCFWSKEVSSLLKSLLAPVYHIHCYLAGKRKEPIGTGSSLLLTGCVGVGKTTLLVGFFVLLVIFTENILPCYVEFGSSSNLRCSPIDIMKQHLFFHSSRLYEEFTASSKPILQFLQEKSISACFLCDEIQYLYDNNAINVDIIQKIATIGKTTFHFAVASGSSVKTKDLCFYPDKYGYPSYQTLNNSVFREIKLLPIRDQEEFSRIVRLLTFDREFTYDEFCELFLRTGGVPRFLCSINEPVTLVPVSDLYYSNVVVEALVNRMMLKVSSSLVAEGKFDPWKSSHSLFCAEVLSIAKDLLGSYDKAKEALDELVEKSVIVVIENKVELLRPGMLNTVYNLSGNELMGNRFEQFAFEGTLLGWNDDYTKPYPSPGHLKEEPIRRMIAKQKNLVYDSGFEFDFKISSCLASSYLGRIVQGLSNLEGIAGFCISKSDSGYDLEVTQIKTGRLELFIEKGTVASKNTFTYIIQSGMNTVKKLLKKFAGEQPLMFTKFTLITTKRIHSNCEAFIKDSQNFKCDQVQYECKIILADEVLKEIELNSLVLKNLKKD